MPKRLLWAGVFVLLALGAFWIYSQKTFQPKTPPPPPKAFLNALWGMSPSEIELANSTILQVSQSRRKFFTPREEIQDQSRYQSLEQSGFKFLGHEATVTYAFFDGRLFAYHVFIQDRDEHALDKEMRTFLTREFGKEYSLVNEESFLKMIWQSRDLIVNYWFFQEELTLQRKYVAAFGVVYSPFEAAIKN